MADGKPPRDLPPGDTDELARRGFGVLLGPRIDWAIPVWEEIGAAGALPEEADEDAAETPDEVRQSTLFDRWPRLPGEPGLQQSGFADIFEASAPY